MLLLLVLLNLSPSVIQAAPTCLDNSTVTRLTASSTQLPTCYPERSIWDILWSCLATVFACTWVSIHPNIPPQNEKWWMAPLRRLELMIWAILAPELMILWALRQWIGARKLANKFKAQRWTKTHGYFLQMGGFVVLKGEDFQGVVYYENGGREGDKNIQELAAENKFPKITEEEIQDRSKGDGLSKALAIGQTLWFVMQCIARRIEGLYITELELATGAFAVLNGLIYFLWWNKPLDVRCPVPIQLSDAQPRQEPSNDVTLAQTKTKPSTKPLSAILSGILYRLGDICNARKRGGLPGSTFYSSTDGDEDDLANLYASVAAVIFGGIHCVGWVFTFPSHAELIIWRICSIVITTIPLFALMTLLCLADLSPESWWTKALLNIVLILGIVSIPLYIIARVLLLAEAFTTLRGLPPCAYEVVRWVTFIPHI